MKFPKLWDVDAERGTILALVVATVYFGIFGHIDPALPLIYALGNLPYSILWAWLSPYWWQTQPYMMILMVQSLAIYAVQWKLVKMGKISKTMFIMNLFVNTMWMAWTTPQYVLTTIWTPLATINPLFVMFEIILKFPVGWSWNFSDTHVQCGIYGNCGYGIFDRWSTLAPNNWAHIFVVIMWILPVIVWFQNRRRKK